jgi:hypothetical protein
MFSSPSPPFDGQFQLDPNADEMTVIKTHLKLVTTLASHYFNRLQNTNTLALNRRLRRAFDIEELSALSNSIIDNIIRDVQNMPKRFPEAGEEGNVIGPVVKIVIALLKEIGKQRKTVNEYGTAYVSKLEALGRKEAEERLRDDMKDHPRSATQPVNAKAVPIGSGNIRRAATAPNLTNLVETADVPASPSTSFLRRAVKSVIHAPKRDATVPSMDQRSSGFEDGYHDSSGEESHRRHQPSPINFVDVKDLTAVDADHRRDRECVIQ